MKDDDFFKNPRKLRNEVWTSENVVVNTNIVGTKKNKESIFVSKISKQNHHLDEFSKTLMLICWASKNAKECIYSITGCNWFWTNRRIIIFTKMKCSESRTVQLLYFIRSSYDIVRYIPRYLRVSWWTLRPSMTKRISETF